ncbi:MAG: hypothetical protein GEU89_00590 [Kiloniellaceae bacterium]|jgi:hypothetical protein|nr:hypothetical protein [Kiloniellaceae bacterium]
MTDGLDRAEIISLLETLGSDNDEEVLAAARVLDTKVAAAGTSWSVLLTAGTRTAEAETEADEAPEAAAVAALPADEAAKNAETLALIDKLLARSGHSDDLRQELEDYKTDLAEGEFKDADHSYIRALYRRLSG